MINANVRVEDNSEAFLRALKAAQDAGLHAQAQAYQRDMKRELRGGAKGFIFTTTTGNVGHIVKGRRRPWYTGLLWNSVTIGTLEQTPSGTGIRVGTNVKYALYWELGHHNIYTKHFERDAKWVPTVQRNANSYRLSFEKAFAATMQANLGSTGAASAEVGGSA